MTRLLDDPPAIKVAVQRLECIACGAETNATCTCGVGYKPKAMLAAEAIKANPAKSNRMIAAELGVSEPTVRRARAKCVIDDAVEPESEKRVGLDGKTRKVPAATSPDGPIERGPTLLDQAQRHLDKIIPLLRQMDHRQRVAFRTSAFQQMGDVYLDDDVIEY